MPLRMTAAEVPNECDGASWDVDNLDDLAKRVALILVSQHEHVLSLGQASATLVPASIPKRTVVQAVLSDVLRAPTSDQDRYHRDGLLFQHIMWVAGSLMADEGDIFSRPHVRKADKGHDMLVVKAPPPPSGGAGVEVEAVQICEHKASEHPRQKITEQVWPDIVSYETGAADASLESEVLAILSEAHGRDAARAILQRLFWEDRRRYRVSVAAKPKQCAGNPRNSLFDGFAACASGAPERRFGDTFSVQELRTWFDTFADAVRVQLVALGEVTRV